MTFMIFPWPAGTSKNCKNSLVIGLWHIVFKFAGASPKPEIAADHSRPRLAVRAKFKAKGFEKTSVFMYIYMQAKLRGCSCWVRRWQTLMHDVANSGVYVQMNASEAPRLQLLRGKLCMMWNISWVEDQLQLSPFHSSDTKRKLSSSPPSFRLDLTLIGIRMCACIRVTTTTTTN